ncbi:hypothetical protein GII30_02580 [Gordonia amarae]|uniref:Uncharacterized protein n=2 Tax=Gordonia amarae TaxID=36821 RepID=G7GN44_9ACTN|nr:hypothetical protein [Gordonia amarae]MCS3877243.1 hypothetical protein [Gordonia amarae]QHN16005.1 hypothetical protein GII35_02515 [Gordonia amarae]QHN20574.1 hypothetical protein GII34_02515 [Gordonia amarae]QHN29425.1 hypothetical protein GII32_02520 [Gordonia amarae]QHN38213.1 hypothetical protein GII30_02580 [Gordonia amarae]
MTRLETHQQVPVTPQERAELRELAAAHGVSPGIFARALLMHARGLLGDPVLAARIDAEKRGRATRSSEAATTAARARWGVK